MLEDLWDGVIGFTEQFVVPDWGAAVALIPIALAALVAAYLLWVGARFAGAGPTRRGVRRIEPVPPPGTHMPGPSFAPILAAVGAFLLLFGVVAGGAALWLGAIALFVTLLYWGREALRDYDHIPDVTAEAPPQVPAVVDRTPPPGVHIPPPSFRPFLVAVALTVLLAGLVIGGWVLAGGIIVTIIVLLGWLWDARKEYRAVEEADRTGHLDLGPAPAWPKGTLATLAVIVVATVVLSSGILPIGSGQAADGGDGAPPASGEPGGSGEPAAPSDAPQPEADVTITALNIAFVETQVAVPADREFTIAFVNEDAGVPHNVEIRDGSGATVFNGEIFNGVETRIYTVPALAAGTYPFICSVHPNMTGTMTAG